MGGNLSLRGGGGGPPPRKLRNMKYSRSDSKPIGPIFQPLFWLNMRPYFVNKLLKNNNLLSIYSSHQTQIKYAKLVNDALMMRQRKLVGLLALYIELKYILFDIWRITYRDNECWVLYIS